MAAVSGLAESLRVNSMPVIPGMLMSSSIRSGRKVRALPSPSNPLDAASRSKSAPNMPFASSMNGAFWSTTSSFFLSAIKDFFYNGHDLHYRRSLAEEMADIPFLLEQFRRAFVQAAAGEHYYRDIPGFFFSDKHARQFDACNIRHHDIRKYDIREYFRRFLRSYAAVFRGEDLKIVLQRALEQLAEILVVVHNQHFFPVSHEIPL